MNRTPLSFFVQGVPVPKGSTKAFMRPGMKFPVVTNDNAKTKPWCSLVALTALEAVLKSGWKIAPGPVAIRCVFSMPRPRFHFGTGKNAAKLRSSAPRYHTRKPDGDKLERAVFDALKNVVWHDDAQVVRQHAEKQYAYDGQHCGVRIEVTELEVAP